MYDVHSPRVPSSEEVQTLINKALKVFRRERLWINPDCGLKTRGWEEIRLALTNIVAAARRVRHYPEDKEDLATGTHAHV